MLTAQEEAELALLEDEFSQSQSVNTRRPAPSRQPGDLENINFSAGMLPDEEAELQLLEAEFAERPMPGPANEKGYLTQIGETIDSYTGAPVRQAIGTFQDTNDIRQAGSAFIDQFGANPNNAPTGKEIVMKAGIEDDTGKVYTNPKTGITSRTTSSDAGILGFGVDVAADWTNLLPFVPAAKIAKGAASTSGWALKNSAKAVDAATGTKFVKAGEAAATVTKATAEATKKAKIRLSKLFKPDVADDFNDLASVAEREGIDLSTAPDAIKYGENSVISRQSRAKAEGPLGGDDLIKHEKFTQDVSRAAEKKIQKIAMAQNVPDKQIAGGIIREGYQKGVDDFFKKMDFTYDSIIKSVPGIELTPQSRILIDQKMAGIEKKAIGLVKRGISATDRSQGKELLNAVAAYRNAGSTLKQQKEAMNMIGRTAFKSVKSSAELPSDIRSLREMYFSLQKGFTESVRKQLGDDIAEALIENNKQMSQHFTERGPIAKIIDSAKADEDVFKGIIERGDSKQIAAIKKIMTMGDDTSQWDAVRGAYLDSLLNKTSDGAITFNSTRKKLNGLQGRLKNIFSEDELLEMDDILRLGDRAGQAVLSTSGTGGSIGFKNIRGSIEDFIVNDTVTDWMKQGADARYNNKLRPPLAPSAAAGAVNQAPKQSKSGIQMLRENAPFNKQQAAKGAQVESVNERNKRLEYIKRARAR